MSLGSIAHLQHYFARTGLLDGKGAQLYHGTIKKKMNVSEGTLVDQDMSALSLSPPMSMRSSPDPMSAIASRAPSEDRDGIDADVMDDPTMLPPTASTYNHRQKHVPPPPDLDELCRELRRSLGEARTMLQDTTPERKQEQADGSREDQAASMMSSDGSSVIGHGTAAVTTGVSPTSPGWNEVQGLNILDTMTLAIRAAKMYYTAHEQPARLASFKSERKLREELFGVLDLLKRMAMRNFAGGLRPYERDMMLAWIDGVNELLRHEETLERVEHEERQSWRWMRGDWTGQERQREWLFLRSFDLESNGDALPRWDQVGSDDDRVEAKPFQAVPTPFLKAIQSGLRLVRLHNEMVRKSRKPFGHITTFHTDTMKPYRCAENLRYWIKAAELRWDVVLKVDVMSVVYDRAPEAWHQFDREMLRWCGRVRQEIVTEWEEKLSFTLPSSSLSSSSLTINVSTSPPPSSSSSSSSLPRRPSSPISSSTEVTPIAAPAPSAPASSSSSSSSP